MRKNRKTIRRAAVALLACSLVLTTSLVAEERVVVVGDGRWRDCSNSGGTPYGDAAGNYGGCSYDGFPGWDSSIDPGAPGPIGGGGGPAPPDLTPQDIPAKLKCALDNYLHNNVKLTDGRPMKKVNAWAFGRRVGGNLEIRRLSINVSPGEDWKPVGGQAGPDSAYGRLYNLAFQVSNNFQRDGSRANASDNSLSGNLSAFETSLFAAAHEAAHMRGIMNEAEADWYGIDAVLRHRSDGGAKCPN